MNFIKTSSIIKIINCFKEQYIYKYHYYRAVNEECAEDDNSEKDGAGGPYDFELAVLVGEEDHDWETADDDALKHKENRPQDNVEAGDAG